MGDFFNTILVYPIINVLVVIYHVLSFFHIPFPLGFSIIVLTALIRVVLYPFMASQLKASRKMQELTPHLNNIKQKHKNDTKRQQEEAMKLYKEHGVNPAMGCLPVIIQFPLIIALYSVLQNVVNLKPEGVMQYINSIAYVSSLRLTAPWDTHFFGIPLGQHPSQLFAAMPVILLIPVVTAVLQFVQSQMMMPPVPKEEPIKKGKNGEKEADGATEFAKAFQTQSLYVFPLMLGYLSYTFPIGLSLYWNTFTIFGILQQYQISGWGGMSEWSRFIPWKK